MWSIILLRGKDLRIFLAYVGKKVTYKEGVGLDKYNLIASSWALSTESKLIKSRKRKG